MLITFRKLYKLLVWFHVRAREEVFVAFVRMVGASIGSGLGINIHHMLRILLSVEVQSVNRNISAQM
jgi:hypothetical protein